MNDNESKYNPEIIVIPPFKRLPEGSCPNVHRMIQEDEQKKSISDYFEDAENKQ